MSVADLRGILLAAGASMRFGSDKLLYPLESGVPIAVLAARRLLRVLPDSMAVVRLGDEELGARLAAEGLGIVVNPDADAGMGASLACGVRATAQASGWVIALADMPWISTDTIREVVRRLRTGAAIAAPVYGGRRGHPVGFGHVLREELITLFGDKGARGLLARHAALTQLFGIDDPGCLLDVDYPVDLGRGAIFTADKPRGVV